MIYLLLVCDGITISIAFLALFQEYMYSNDVTISILFVS